MSLEHVVCFKITVFRERNLNFSFKPQSHSVDDSVVQGDVF